MGAVLEWNTCHVKSVHVIMSGVSHPRCLPLPSTPDIQLVTKSIDLVSQITLYVPGPIPSTTSLSYHHHSSHAPLYRLPDSSLHPPPRDSLCSNSLPLPSTLESKLYQPCTLGASGPGCSIPAQANFWPEPAPKQHIHRHTSGSSNGKALNFPE